jgi:SSS family solute:Na+ symporter
LHVIDYIITIATILAVVIAGLPYRKYVKSVKDYLLAGRTQRWPVIALNCQATQSDIADYMGCTGYAYQHGALGLSNYTINLQAGWLLGAHTIIPQMYRAGVWTPAEYLEHRFNYPARIWGALLIVLQRVYVVGAILNLMGIMLEVLTGTSFLTATIFGAALCIGYTILGGISAAMITGTAQMILMTITSWVLFVAGLLHVGGWHRLLELTGPGMIKHAITGETIPVGWWTFHAIPSYPTMLAGLAFLGMLASTISYPIIQAEQVARPLSARSEWDARMGYQLAGFVALIHQFAIVPVGAFAVLAYGYMSKLFNPALGGRPDAVYPYIMKDWLPAGLVGLVLAGVFAATLSTVPSNTQSCAGILTRDIYGKLIKKDGTDAHYLLVARILTAFNFIGGLFFIPLVQKGGGYIMVYIKITGALISPLFAVFIWGVLTKFLSRNSAFGAMIIGGICGSIIGLYGKTLFPQVPLLNHWLLIPLWNIIFTSVVLFIWSAIENGIRGRRPDAEIEGYTVGTFPPQVKPYLQKRVERINKRGECVETDIPYYGTAGIPWYKSVKFWGWVILIYLVVWTIYWW